MEHEVVRGLSTQPVKSAFELPWEAELAATRGRTLELHGRSWSGGAPIRRVDVSTDGGACWERPPARAQPRARQGALDAAVALARARPPRAAGPCTDRDGLVQPDTEPFNDNGYQFWAVVRHPVRVA